MIVDSNGQALAYVYGHADPRHTDKCQRAEFLMKHGG
jgi:hypothetical protein